MKNIWDPTHVLNVDDVNLILLEQFPSIPIVSIEKIGEGFDNTVFNLNNETLLRFPRRDIAVKILEIEERLLPYLKNHVEIQTTFPILFGKSSKLFPWPFLGYNFIKGNPPITLNKEERIQLIEPIAKFLKQLHSIPVKELFKLDIPYDELRRLDIGYRLPKLKQYSSQAIQLNLIPNEDGLKYYIKNLKDIKCNTKLSLVHGDFHFKNIIVNENNMFQGVIDWGDAHIGQKEVDLSIVYSLIPSDSRDIFFNLYGNVSEESKKVAKFKAIFTIILLLLYANDLNDIELVKFCQENLSNALND